MPNDKTAAAQAPATAEKTAGAAPDTAATTAKTAPATTPPTATAGSATLPGTGRRTAAITVLVTGANGQLGNEMRRIAATDATTAPAVATAPGNVRYLFTDVAELDITDPQAVRRTMRENDVEVIVNCAAYTNVNKAEEDEAAADLLNHRAVANLAAAARERGATLIHISTDYVFGGDGNVPRREDDPVRPLGVYGRTKLAGEKAIAEAGCAALILRTAWLYSEFGNIHIISILYEIKHIHFPDKTPTPNVRPQPGRCKTSNKVKNLTPRVQDGQVPVCGIQSDADVYVHFLPPRRLSL